MNLKWEYHAENIGTDEPVAKLLKGGGNITVLQVYAGTDCYFTRPSKEYSCFIDRAKVPYEDVNNFMVSQRSVIPMGKENESAIKYACIAIETNFKRQANIILNLLA